MVAGVGPSPRNSYVPLSAETQGSEGQNSFWNREEFGNIFEDKKRLLCELDLINRKGMEVGWDEDMKVKEKDLMNQIEARER